MNNEWVYQILINVSNIPIHGGSNKKNVDLTNCKIKEIKKGSLFIPVFRIMKTKNDNPSGPDYDIFNPDGPNPETVSGNGIVGEP